MLQYESEWSEALNPDASLIDADAVRVAVWAYGGGAMNATRCPVLRSSRASGTSGKMCPMPSMLENSTRMRRVGGGGGICGSDIVGSFRRRQLKIMTPDGHAHSGRSTTVPPRGAGSPT